MIPQSSMLKQAALNWLRFSRQYSFIATEVGSFSADCFGASLKKSVEIEIKCHWSDFKRDFAKRKHSKYANAALAPRYDRLWIPNQFYILIVPSLRDQAMLFLKDYPHCGLMIYRSEKILDQQVEVIKRAPPIHGNSPSMSVIQALGSRMSSELLTHYFFKSYLDEEKQRLSVLFSSIKTLAERALESAGGDDEKAETINSDDKNEIDPAGDREQSRPISCDERTREAVVTVETAIRSGDSD